MFFLLFGFITVLCAFLVQSQNRKSLIAAEKTKLTVVASDKVSSLLAWKREREADAQISNNNVILNNAIDRILQRKVSGEERKQLLQWLDAYKNNRNYKDICLLDAHQNIVAESTNGDNTLGTLAKQYAKEALESGQIKFNYLHSSPAANFIHLDMFVPIIGNRDGIVSPVGTLLIRIDPGIELYHIVSSWPTSTKTSESILIQQTPDGYRALNEVGKRQGEFALEPVPLSERFLSKTLGSNDTENLLEVGNWNGKAVLMNIQRVPGTPWILITKIDKNEFFWPVSRSAWIIGLLASAIALISSFIFAKLSARVKRHLAQRLEEKDRHQENLHKRLSCLIEFSNDAILLYDSNYFIIDANEKASCMYACSKEELTNKQITEFIKNDSIATIFQRHNHIRNAGAATFEEVHIDKYGDEIPVNNSVRLLILDGNEYFQAVIRDISERQYANKIILESEMKYLSLFENSFLGFFRATTDLQLLSANTTLARMLGFNSVYSLLSRSNDNNDFFFGNKTNFRHVSEMISDAPYAGKIEISYNLPSGQSLTGSLHIWPAYDVHKNIICYEGFLEDITEQKSMADQLIQSERKFRAIFENVRDAIFLVNDKNEWLTCNPAAVRMFRCSAERLLAERADTFSPLRQPDNELSTKKVEALRKEHQSGKDLKFEWQHKRADGSVFDSEVTLTSFELDGQKMSLIMIHDLSELKRMERSFQESEARFKGLADMLPEVIFEADLAGKLTYANADAFEKYGYSQVDLEKGLYVQDLVRPDDHKGLRKEIADKLSGRNLEPYSGEFTSMTRNGKEFPVIVYAKPIVQNGVAVGFRGIVIDITERKASETQIKAQAAQLRAIMDNLPFDFWTIDKDGRYGFQNSLSRRLWGDVIGMLPEEVAPTASVAEIWENNNKKAMSGEVVKSEIEYKAENSVRSCINILAPMFDEESVYGVIGVNIDITEQKEAESALNRSEARYRMLFMELMSGFSFHEIICDESGVPCDYRFIEVNPAFEKLTGLKRDQVIGKRVLEILPDTEPYWIERYGRVALSGLPDYSVQESKEFGRIYESRAFSPEIGKFAVVFNDVTEQRTAEEKMRFQASLLDQVRNAVIASDKDGKIIFWNRQAEALYQWTQAEAMGQSFRRLIIPSSSTTAFDWMDNALCSSGYWEGEVQACRKDGSLVPVFMTTAVLANIEGVHTGFVGISVDMSDQRKLEEQLLHAQKMEAVGRLAGGVAHDFNNILTAIIGYGQMLNSRFTPLSVENQQMEVILSSAERAADLTRNLLAFSRKEIMNAEPTDINMVITRILKLLRRLIGEDVELDAELLNIPLIVNADKGQIEQVLMNLATNSRDAMPEGGKISITTDLKYIDREFVNHNGDFTHGNYVHIAFSDTGVGIGNDMVEKIFDPFYTTKEPGKGTGLGLSIVHGIISQHAGHVLVDSSPTSGTTFNIYLPSDEKGASAQSRPVAEQPRGGNETILLAEDDETVRELHQMLLESFGYQVITAVDGQDAIEKFEAHAGQIDLLLLDVVMPKKSGSVAYSEITKSKQDVKVLFVSGYPIDFLNANTTFNTGFNFLQKPASPSGILQKVRDAIDGTCVAETSAFTASPAF